MSGQYCPGSRVITWKRKQSYHKHRDGRTFTHAVSTMSPLTVVRVVPDNVVSSTPVPQKKRGISGAWHDVAVSSDVGLWPGQTRHDIPVAKNYLGELSCGEEGGGQISQRVDLPTLVGRLVTRVKKIWIKIQIHDPTFKPLINWITHCRFNMENLPVSVE